MRTIKFRGKEIKTGEWKYGDLMQLNDGSIRIGVQSKTWTDDGYHNNDYEYEFNVDEKTIGQFTGLLDKDGVEIYDGDIVELREPNGMPNICKVEMCEKGYWCVSFGIHERIILGFIDKNQITVTGNIHDNSELLND